MSWYLVLPVEGIFEANQRVGMQALKTVKLIENSDTKLAGRSVASVVVVEGDTPITALCWLMPNT